MYKIVISSFLIHYVLISTCAVFDAAIVMFIFDQIVLVNDTINLSVLVSCINWHIFINL